jgi:hypothetical protein
MPDGIPEDAPEGAPDPGGRPPPRSDVQSPDVLTMRTVAAATVEESVEPDDEDEDDVVGIDGSAITHVPTLTADADTDFSRVNFVEAVQVTAVCASVLCTCAVLPETAAILPDAPGIRPPMLFWVMPCWVWSLLPEPASADPELELDPQALSETASVVTVAARMRGFFMDVLLLGKCGLGTDQTERRASIGVRRAARLAG